MKRKKRPYICPLSWRERRIATALLPVHILVLPLLLSLLQAYWPGGFSDLQRSTLHYGISFVLLLLLLFRCLRRNWSLICDRCLSCLYLLLPTHLLFILFTFVSALLLLFLPRGLFALFEQALSELNGPNGHSRLTLLVLLIPVVDETLFRGLLFGMLREKNRVAAYLVSMLLYVACTIFPYAVRHPDITVLPYVLQELPFAFALTWNYERSGTIWSPIFYHALCNLLPSLHG